MKMYELVVLLALLPRGVLRGGRPQFSDQDEQRRYIKAAQTLMKYFTEDCWLRSSPDGKRPHVGVCGLPDDLWGWAALIVLQEGKGKVEPPGYYNPYEEESVILEADLLVSVAKALVEAHRAYYDMEELLNRVEAISILYPNTVRAIRCWKAADGATEAEEASVEEAHYC